MSRRPWVGARGALVCVALLGTSALAAAQEVNPPKGPADIMNQAAQGRSRAEVERAARIAESAAAGRDASAAEPPANAASQNSAATPQSPAATPQSPAATPQSSAATPQSSAATPQGSAAGPQEPAMGPREEAGHPDGDPHASGSGRDPHKVLAEPELPTAEPATGTPAGSIEIDVVGSDGKPQAGAEIVLGVMASMGSRTEQRAKSDAEGRYAFRNLAVGSQQAYRVNVLYQGGKFSSMPFRLSEDKGYHVRIPLRATTTDRAMLFQVVGQTVVELRDDRLHITQQARLANAGERVIAFPKDGLLVPLPAGFTAFQWQDQMTDQKAEEAAGQGFRIRGSLPPGSVTLAWTFDLPREGSSARISLRQPWRTYTYRVISEAPEGLKLRVSDFPEAERVQDEHRELLFTQIQRHPSEAQLESFTIRLEGIPGPGPGRWIAVLLALGALAYGLTRAFQPADDGSERTALLKIRKRELLELAKATEAELERGEIGPQYRAQRLDEILTELALVLRDEEALGRATKLSR